MIALTLLLMWITPALVAGMLGWSGIWGGESALFDYLIPIPVAGGALHVPSFAVAAVALFSFKKTHPDRRGLFLTLALAALAVMVTLQIDLERLNQALFTDYDPAGSAIRMESNALYLFITTDALWVAAYAFFSGTRTSPGSLPAILSLPAGIVAYSMFAFNVGGPSFDYGYKNYADARGNTQLFIFTASPWDESAARAWIDQANTLMPWESQNAEHLAIHFTTSMQAIKWGRALEDRDAIVGTLCFYELDQSSTAHPGYFDCFAGHLTFMQKLNQSSKETNTDLGPEVDKWYAEARLCEGIAIPAQPTDIALQEFCQGLQRRYAENIAAITDQYGQESAQVAFLTDHRDLLSLD